jgi:hypothetical protein
VRVHDDEDEGKPDEEFIAANLIRDFADTSPHLMSDERFEEAVKDLAADLTAEFFNETTIKFVTREFLVWVANQNRIMREECGGDKPTVTILSNDTDNPAVTIPLEPTDDEIEALVDSFIELHPFDWHRRSDNPMKWTAETP